MESKKPTHFQPYSNFNSELLRIDEFEELSTIAYGITLQLLFHSSKKELIEIKYPESEWEKSSFSMADQEIEDIVLSCEWITLNDYAARIGSSLDEIRYKASQNQLGPIKEHPETKEKVVIWPPEYQTKALENLPTPDLKLFTAKVSIKSSIPMELNLEDVEQFDEIQKTFLRLAHSLGEPEEVSDRASAILYRVCILLRWVVFENYTRNCIHELFRKHPNKIASSDRSQKPSLSYEDILNLSENFSSIEALCTGLVEKQIEQSDVDGQSIHALINFLKTTFKFEDDPYKAWYIMRGKRYETDYNTLLEIKEVRNALIHKNGMVNDDFHSRFPDVPLKENVIILDEEYNTKSLLIIKSIAFKIAHLIVNEKYSKD